mmetsp:Transcript_26632/g.52473  ORF Transcript_26632/g.52473 Transcript_26632/m.52473 type:complete len:201 (+) Transcript_26632:1425-2027(+)
MVLVVTELQRLLADVKIHATGRWQVRQVDADQQLFRDVCADVALLETRLAEVHHATMNDGVSWHCFPRWSSLGWQFPGCSGFLGCWLVHSFVCRFGGNIRFFCRSCFAVGLVFLLLRVNHQGSRSTAFELVVLEQLPSFVQLDVEPGLHSFDRCPDQHLLHPATLGGRFVGFGVEDGIKHFALLACVVGGCSFVAQHIRN